MVVSRKRTILVLMLVGVLFVAATCDARRQKRKRAKRRNKQKNWYKWGKTTTKPAKWKGIASFRGGKAYCGGKSLNLAIAELTQPTPIKGHGSYTTGPVIQDACRWYDHNIGMLYPLDEKRRTNRDLMRCTTKCVEGTVTVDASYLFTWECNKVEQKKKAIWQPLVNWRIKLQVAGRGTSVCQSLTST